MLYDSEKVKSYDIFVVSFHASQGLGLYGLVGLVPEIVAARAAAMRLSNSTKAAKAKVQVSGFFLPKSWLCYWQCFGG